MKPYAYPVITDGSHELALTIINDGRDYRRRAALGAMAYNGGQPGSVTRSHALEWLTVAQAGARAYDRQFGSPGASSFTVVDILGAALELAEYYEQHARETAAVEG